MCFIEVADIHASTKSMWAPPLTEAQLYSASHNLTFDVYIGLSHNLVHWPHLFSCLLSKQSFKIKCWTSVTRLKTQKMKSPHQSPHTEARTQQTTPPLIFLLPILERVSPNLQTHQDYNTATVNSTSQTVKKKTTWNLLIMMHTRRSLQAHNRCEELPLGLQSKATKEELYLRL